MAYRDDVNALETRRAALEGELFQLRSRQREFEALKDRAAELEKELATTKELLAGAATTQGPSLLDNVRVASPCSVDWESMVGDDRTRFCGQCAKNVYNLSSMTRAEADEFLRTQTSELCVRLYRRTDGTVLTSDCSVGVRRKRRRHLAVIAIGAGGLLASAASFGTKTTMGAMQHMPKTVVSDTLEPSIGQMVEMGEAVPMQGGISAPPPRHVTVGHLPKRR